MMESFWFKKCFVLHSCLLRRIKTIVFVVVLISCCGTLSAETLVPITVSEGGSLIRLTRKYCTSKWHWREIAKINNIKKPYLIKAGDFLNIPLELLKTERLSARVGSVYGKVFLLRGEKQLKQLVKGDNILPGQTIVTGRNSFTHLIFPDNKYTRIGGDSNFTLTYIVRLIDKSLKADFFLKRGKITHIVKKKLDANETFTTRTPVSVTGVRGTEFRLKMDDNDTNIVETLTGVVGVKGFGKLLSVKRGEGTRVKRGKMPEPVRRLPSPPAISTVKEVYKALPIVLAVPYEQSLDSYRIRVCVDKLGKETILEQTVRSGGNFTLMALADGRYYAFLTAVDHNQFESISSGPFSFSLRTVPSAPIIVHPLQGRMSFENAVGIAWLKGDRAERFFVQLAGDSAFKNIVDERIVNKPHFTVSSLKAGNYFFRVQAIAEDGFRSLFSLVDSWTVQAHPSLEKVELKGDGGLDLHWEEMGSGIQYDLQVSKNRQFTDLFIDEAKLTEPHYLLSDYLEPGDYYIRIRGVLPDGQVSPWTDSQRVTVDQPPFGWVDASILLTFLAAIIF